LTGHQLEDHADRHRLAIEECDRLVYAALPLDEQHYRFAEGVAGAAHKSPPPSTEAGLQAKLHAARMRLHEVVILGMKRWPPAEKGPAPGRGVAARVGQTYFQVLEHFREEHR
jgi:hypothetical protein